MRRYLLNISGVFFLLVLLIQFSLLSAPFVFAAENTPYFVVGDGSGGGGAGGNQGMSGGNGGGDNDTLDYSSSTATNVIFGDGSGGGGGGRGVGFTNNVVVGGLAGGGNDTITTGSGNDIIFGDGFNGINTADGVFYPGSGGLGGGGGGAAGGGFGGPPPGFAGGICGGGGGGGTHNGGTFNVLVACGNSTKGDPSFTTIHGGNGGNAATPESGSQGLGGAYSTSHGGGGGGFGGASGGSGVTAPQNGNTSQYRVEDTSSAIRNYFTEAVLRGVLTNYPNYGAGADTINGKGGTNELFGLGGNDAFIVDSADSAVRNRIWDFSPGDTLILKTNGTIVATVDVNSYVSGATVGDYDGDGASDDTRISFMGTNIDLSNITSIVTNSSGNIGATNHAPTISLADSNLSYTVNAAATQIDSAGTVSDTDGNTDWNGGTLSAQITANSTGSDTISLSGTNIEITGTTLKYTGASIGVVSSTNGTVTGNTALTITFNSGTTGAIVQTILQNIRFSTSSSGTTDRVVKMVATDKNGASVDDSRTIDVSGAVAITYYTATASASTGGSISPSSRSLASGSTGTFTITPDGGYSINTVSGCSGSLSGTTYTTGAVTGDCSITASFTANSYSVVFETQGGDAVSTITQAYGTSLSLPSATKTGGIFSSWNTRADATGTTYNAAQNINMPVNGITLYAQWAPTLSNISASPSETSAVITWTSNEESSSQVQYGLNTAYGFTTTETDTSTRVISHTISLTNLSACTRYYYRVISKNSSNNQSASSQKTFNTLGCATSNIENGSENLLTTSGGAVELVNDLSTAQLTIPDGYAAEDATFQINKLSSASPPAGPEGKNLAKGNLYELVAVTSSDVKLTSFSVPLTFTISYGSDTESDYIENTLDVYKYNGSSWDKKNCVLDTEANTLTCSLSSFSTYGVLGTPKPITNSNSSSSTSSSSSSTTPTKEECSMTKPKSAPDLFEINSQTESTTLYFTPLSDTHTYFISFSEDENAERHGAVATLSREGVQNYTVYELKPNTKYYAKVRGENGCMPGEWSNIMSFNTNTGIYYKNGTGATDTMQTNSVIPIIKEFDSIEKATTNTPIPTKAVSAKSSKNMNKKPPTNANNFCILWWCF